MPTYLLHGFRWPRQLIRIHIILQNLDDAAAEWLIAPQTSKALLENLHANHPDIMADLPGLRFIEQHDASDSHAATQPYAYVADMCHEVRLGVDVDDIRGRGVANEQWSALVDLRDKLCPNEKVAWFVVVCGDEERVYTPATPTRGSTARTSSSGTRATDVERASTRRNRSPNRSPWDENGEARREAPPRRVRTPESCFWGEFRANESAQQRSNSISRGFKRMFGRKETENGKPMNWKHSNASSSKQYSDSTPPPPLPREVLPGTAV